MYLRKVIILLVVTATVSSCANNRSLSKAPEPEALIDTNQADLVVGTQVGNLAPDIIMQDPDGKTFKLSELRGNIVLVDFWASWCGPCRKENPNLVAAYNKYSEAKFKKAKGFKIYSVSLDNNRQNWHKAILSDHLAWPQHVSDLQGWNNASAIQYGVRAIPTNFLINHQGVIIAKSLRGIRLHQAIDPYVRKF